VDVREKSRERRSVGKRMILGLMYVLIERIELIILHSHVFVEMVAYL
jgi:hypothetical protein